MPSSWDNYAVSNSQFMTILPSHWYWPDPIQTVHPGVQMAAEHGSWIPGRELCWPVSSIDGHWHLRSARRGHELACQHTEDACSVMLTISLECSFQEQRTVSVLLYTPAQTSFSTSRPTSTLRAFDVFTVNALYKFATHYLLTLFTLLCAINWHLLQSTLLAGMFVHSVVVKCVCGVVSGWFCLYLYRNAWMHYSKWSLDMYVSPTLTHNHCTHTAHLLCVVCISCPVINHLLYDAAVM